MFIPVCEEEAQVSPSHSSSPQSDRYTETEGGGRRLMAPSLLHPAVSAYSSAPPPFLPSLPLGIECSQSGRWVECIIHRLFGGWEGALSVCVCSRSTGSRLRSHYRSNGCVLDAAPCQSHLKCKSQMSVKSFITHVLCARFPSVQQISDVVTTF